MPGREPGALFDQDEPGFSLPERYERPDEPIELEVHRAWHLPAPFDRVRLGLRARATFALALGAFIISVVVSTLTFVVARSSFLNARQSSAQRLAYSNADAVQSALAVGANVRETLANQRRSEAISVLVRPRPGGGQPSVMSSEPGVGIERIPASLDAMLDSSSGLAGYQTVNGPNGAELVIGVQLRGLTGARFYEIVDLDDEEDNLARLGQTLAAAALLSTLGSALVGRSVSRQVVRPLRNVANAALEISSGHLDTRLSPSGDVDLDPLLLSFNNMASSLQERLEREARFASDVSHELRTPLTALTTAARLLDGRRDEMDERSQRALDVLVTQTNHFERLVLDLLEISRFDAGAAELHREVINLPEFVRQVVALNVREDQPHVEIDTSELLYAEVNVDKRRVERVIANLLQNAANYGGGATRVALQSSRSTGDLVATEAPSDEKSDHPDHPEIDQLRIIVEDHGPGVPDDEKPVIFERFRRGHLHQRGTNAPKGTGLGLALVAAHASLHGGAIWVEDRPGGGARFVVELGLVPSEVDE